MAPNFVHIHPIGTTSLNAVSYQVIQQIVNCEFLIQGRGVYTGGNGSSCFQAELGGDKISPPAPWIHPGLNSMEKEIIKKYKKWGKLKNQKDYL